MIDQSKRSKFAEGIRAISAGLITNDEFEEIYFSCKSFEDPAIREIFLAGIWPLFSDFKKEFVAFDFEQKSKIARCILFLKTNNPYEWPSPGALRRFTKIIINVMSLGVAAEISSRTYRRSGDIDVWPFINRKDYDVALKNPVYLRG